jgi:5-(carboxyamino)imidazole ribonucleotide synthase
LLVNEIAPRPHNSGHYTLDACLTNQFEQQVRALTGLPLGSTQIQSPAVMVNLLGDIWLKSESTQPPPWETILSIPGLKLHLYGKTEPRAGRKMGHFTALAPTLDQALAFALQARQNLGFSNEHAG